MEILPLLQSDCILPNDIVLSEIYSHLWRLKCRSYLSKELRDAIVNDHFRFKKIVVMYYNNEIVFSRNKKDDDYFLIWLDNDLIGVLNDGKPLIYGISDKLREECPSIKMEYLLECVSADNLPDKVYELWKMMTPDKKKKMYELTCIDL